MSVLPPQVPSQSPPSQAPNAPGGVTPALDFEELGRPKGVPVVVTVAALIGGLLLGVAIGGLAFSGSSEAKAMPSASASPPPPAASSAPPPAPPKSLAELATEGDTNALKTLESKPPKERSGQETLALFRGDFLAKKRELEELARKTELVEAFGKSEDTQKKFMDAVKDPRQSTSTLEILAALKGPIGPDYLYKVSRMPGRNDITERLALDLLHSKDIFAKASDALKVLLEMNEELEKEQKDCAKMQKLLLRAQADGDTRAFSPIAQLNKKRGCGDNKLKDCWECLRDGEGKKALADAIKLARKNKAPF